MKKAFCAGLCIIAASTMLFGCSKAENKAGEIELADYKNIKMSADDAAVSDDSVESQIQSFLSNYKENVAITEGTAQTGDTVVIDFVGTMDGVAFDGGSKTDASITLGSSGYISGFDDGVVGMAIGETKVLNLQFPETYQDTDKAGKNVDFEVTLKSISRPTTPELTDDFVASHSEGIGDDSVKTVDQLYVYVKELLKKNTVTLYAFNQVIDNSNVKSYNEEGVEAMKKELEDFYNTYYAYYYGVDLNGYLEAVGSTKEEFDSYNDEYVRNYFKQKMVVYEICNKEGISLTDEEKQKGLEDAAANNGYSDVDSYKEAATDLELEDVDVNLLYQKVIDILYANTVIE